MFGCAAKSAGHRARRRRKCFMIVEMVLADSKWGQKNGSDILLPTLAVSGLEGGTISRRSSGAGSRCPRRFVEAGC